MIWDLGSAALAGSKLLMACTPQQGLVLSPQNQDKRLIIDTQKKVGHTTYHIPALQRVTCWLVQESI